MSDKAVASGIYLRGLSRDETIGAMASVLVDHELVAGRFQHAIVTADVILKHAPRSAYVMVKRGSAFAGLLRRDIVAHYHALSEMPQEVQAYADGLYQENLAAFAKAEALGWREQDGEL
jgi:hypothetical protein